MSSPPVQILKWYHPCARRRPPCEIPSPPYYSETPRALLCLGQGAVSWAVQGRQGSLWLLSVLSARPRDFTDAYGLLHDSLVRKAFVHKVLSFACTLQPTVCHYFIRMLKDKGLLRRCYSQVSKLVSFISTSHCQFAGHFITVDQTISPKFHKGLVWP